MVLCDSLINSTLSHSDGYRVFSKIAA